MQNQTNNAKVIDWPIRVRLMFINELRFLFYSQYVIKPCLINTWVLNNGEQNVESDAYANHWNRINQTHYNEKLGT